MFAFIFGVNWPVQWMLRNDKFHGIHVRLIILSHLRINESFPFKRTVIFWIPFIYQASSFKGPCDGDQLGSIFLAMMKIGCVSCPSCHVHSVPHLGTCPAFLSCKQICFGFSLAKISLIDFAVHENSIILDVLPGENFIWIMFLNWDASYRYWQGQILC